MGDNAEYIPGQSLKMTDYNTEIVDFGELSSLPPGTLLKCVRRILINGEPTDVTKFIILRGIEDVNTVNIIGHSNFGVVIEEEPPQGHIYTPQWNTVEESNRGISFSVNTFYKFTPQSGGRKRRPNSKKRIRRTNKKRGRTNKRK